MSGPMVSWGGTAFTAYSSALLLVAWSPTVHAQSKLEQGETAQETYELNALGLVVVAKDPSGSPGGPWRPVRGKYRWAMSYGDFYEAVGRPDLSARQSRHDVFCGALTWGGVATGIAGGYLLVRGLGSDGFTSGAQVGLGLVIGGASAAVIGTLLSGAVISDREAGELVDGYNRNLLRRIPAAHPTSVLDHSADSPGHAAFDPVVASRAWGLSVGGRF